MKYGLVGNNDGPLRLLLAAKHAGCALPDFVGLQKTPDKKLLSKYLRETEHIDFKFSFDEDSLLNFLNKHKFKILINCFCNFKFTCLLKLYDCYNVHPSYLPFYRGRHPMHWALILGEEQHGITIHKMTQEFDKGAIYWQEHMAIHKNMSVGELREGLMQKLEVGFPTFISWLEQEKSVVKSNSQELGSYLRRRYPEDSCISQWDNTDLIYRKIKALRSETNLAYFRTENSKYIPILDVTLVNNQGLDNHRGELKVLDVFAESFLIQLPDGCLFKIKTGIGIKGKLDKNSIIL